MTNHTLQKSMFQSGCIFAGTAVILGAFGAHALKDSLTQTDLATFETGVKYQFFHAFGILLISLSLRKLNEHTARRAWYLFMYGTVIFSTSLYLIAVRSMIGLPETFKAIGAITPIGGLCFISGWAYLAYDGFKLIDGTEKPSSKRRSRRSATNSSAPADQE